MQAKGRPGSGRIDAIQQSWAPLIRALYAEIERAPPEAFQRWKAYFEACGFPLRSRPGRPSPPLTPGALFRLRDPAVDQLAFAVQSAFHLFLALAALRVGAAVTGRYAAEPVLAALLDRHGGSGSFDRRLDRIVNGELLADHGLPGVLEPGFFAWLPDRCGGALLSSIRQLVAAVLSSESVVAEVRQDAVDPFSSRYLSLSPRPIRQALGEYYTPPWLVSLVMDRVGYATDPTVPSRALLDPTCGSGSFLVNAIQRLRASGSGPGPRQSARALARAALTRVRGIDLNPLAVSMCRLNVLRALGPDLIAALGDVPVELPVTLGDALFGPLSCAPADPQRRVDWSHLKPVGYLVGNPPWINWEHLSPQYREAIKGHPMAGAPSLFPHRGLSARGGGAHDDLAALLVYATAREFLEPDGRLGLVVPLSLFKSKAGGAGFRSFTIPEGPAVHVRSVDDLTALRPFGQAVTKAAVLSATLGTPTRYPVRYRRWTSAPGVLDEETAVEEKAVPVDPGNAASPWLTGPGELLPLLQSVSGASDYRARKGVDTSLNAVFWVRILERDGDAQGRGARILNAQTRSRVPIAPCEAVVEASVLYPLLRGRDFQRWRHEIRYHQLLLYDPSTGRPWPLDTAERLAPRAARYFERYNAPLTRRKIHQKFLADQPPYACYDIGPYSFEAPKVVWKALADGIQATVIEHHEGQVIVPDHNVVQVVCAGLDEAHYLCAVLNSRLCTAFAQAYVGWFFSTHLLRHFKVPRYNPALAAHRTLGHSSRSAHAAEGDSNIRALENEINQQVSLMEGLAHSRALLDQY